jgi:hypothetical protein
MMFGDHAPSIAVIEFATGSPFGIQLTGDRLPFFDPYGWDPEKGFDDALQALGWSCDVSKGGPVDEALQRLQVALGNGPVWIGPVEMGHLRHQPGMTGPIGADHYVVVLEIAGGRVLMHDPQGYPYASLPVADFMEAWKAETLDYGEPFSMRTGFKRLKEFSEEETILATIPAAIRWLSMDGDHDVRPGSLGNGEAVEALARLIETGCDEELRGHLIHFAVRVGARRAADAATCLKRIGYVEAAEIAGEQAQFIGSLQHLLTMREDAAAAIALRRLAPTYERLLLSLKNAS